MGDIERWTISLWHEFNDEYQCDDEFCTVDGPSTNGDVVEVVRADRLAGAVKTLVRIAEMRSYQPGDAADRARQTLTLLGVEPFASVGGR